MNAFKLASPTYSYLGDDVCTLGCLLQVLRQDGTVALEYPLSATYNILQEDFVAEIERQIMAGATAYLTKLAALDARRAQLFPGSTDFDTAAAQLVAGVSAKLGGV